MRALVLMLIALLAIAAIAASEQQRPLETGPAPLEAQTAPVQHSGVLRSPDSFREVIPPERYQGDASAVVIFGHANVIASLCGAPNAAGIGPLACAGEKDKTPIIVAPNPCLFADNDLYAAILCHELGHISGWPKDHGD
jgi:hypothetical protein